MTLSFAIFAGFDYYVAGAGDELGQVTVLNVGEVFVRKIRYGLPFGVPGEPLGLTREIQTYSVMGDYLKGVNFALAQDHQINGR